ncbi:MAG: DinB family protein [Desulfobacterales bacterium]
MPRPDPRPLGHPRTRSAGQIFGHIIARERAHVRSFVQGINDDIPESFKVVFHSLTFSDPTEDEVLRAVGSKEHLIAYWRKVRGQTHEYLDSIDDGDLKGVPRKTLLPDNDPNRDNPIREWFVMTIKHQNMAWGEIHMIRRILESN